MSGVKNLVESEFSKAFPQWDRLSKFDPLKMLAKGLGEIFSSMDRIQKDRSVSMVAHLPGILGFLPKREVLPRLRIQCGGAAPEVGGTFPLALPDGAEGLMTIIGPNEAEFKIVRRKFALGSLNGEAWESLKLPERLVEIPDRVWVERGNGEQEEFRRVSFSLEELFEGHGMNERVFLYSPVRHEVVFPFLHRYCDRELEPFSVMLPEAFFLPSCREVESARDARILRPSHAKRPFEGSIEAVVEPGRPRENQREFLRRFEQTMRASMSMENLRTLEVEPLEAYLQSEFESIEKVEIKKLQSEMGIECFVKDRVKLDSRKINEFRKALIQKIPPGCMVRVVPFRVRLVKVFVEDQPQQREHFERKWFERANHSGNGELAFEQVQIQDEDTGRYGLSLTRDKGEWISPKFFYERGAS